MRLLIIGCEYTGKQTLAAGISQWMIRTMGVPYVRWHDHFVVPRLDGHMIVRGNDEAAVPGKDDADLNTDDDVLSINHYYADAVYAPIYHGYGQPGAFADRLQRAREWDMELLDLAPDTVLVHVEADARTVRKRMTTTQARRGPLRQEDVPLILQRFREEFDKSLLHIKITLDTTDSSPNGTLEHFLAEIEPHLSQVDRLRILLWPWPTSLTSTVLPR